MPRHIAILAAQDSWAPISQVELAVKNGGGEVVDFARAEGLLWLDSFNARGLDDALKTAPQTLKWVQLPWAGVEIFVEAGLLERSGDRLIWTCAKGAYGEPVAEHALMMILALFRNLKQCARSDSWISWESFYCATLFDKVVTILGGGGIAEGLISLLQPFRCEVNVVRRHPTQVLGANQVVSLTELDDLLPITDVLLVALPLTVETQNVIGRKKLAMMKSSAVIVNVGRGKVIDTEALVDALSRDELAGAGLDVTQPEPLPDDHPLWDMPNCLITPHIADPQNLSIPHYLKRVEENVRRFVSGEPVIGVVNRSLGY